MEQREEGSDSPSDSVSFVLTIPALFEKKLILGMGQVVFKQINIVI